MNEERRRNLEANLKETLRQHQREGLNMIGNMDQLLHRLVQAVEEWLEEDLVAKRESA